MNAPAIIGRAAADSPSSGAFRHTRWLLLAYYSLCVIWGVRNAWQSVPMRLDILVPLALYTAGSWWVIVDARTRGRAVPLHSRQLFFLIAALLIPAYVVWSRGWRGLGYLMLHGVLGYLLTAIVMNVVGRLVHGAQWMPGAQG